MRRIIMVFLYFIPILAFSQNNNVSWNFPVKPGSEEWLNIPEFNDRLKLLDIPESLLKKLSTEELVKSCLSYPEFQLIFTRNDLQSGYNYIRSIFNGFRELETRNDAAKELIKVYSKYDPIDFDTNSPKLEIGRFMSKFTYIEVILAQNSIRDNLNLSESIELMKLCSNKYKSKKERQNYYSGIGLQTTALIIARQQRMKMGKIKLKYGDKKIDEFINNVSYDRIDFLDEIVVENDNIISNGL